MFPSFVRISQLSLSVKIWISKSYVNSWKGFKYAEVTGKPKHVQDLKGISEEEWAV